MILNFGIVIAKTVPTIPNSAEQTTKTLCFIYEARSMKGVKPTFYGCLTHLTMHNTVVVGYFKMDV